MSIEVMTRVWNTSRQTGNGLLLLLALADFADDKGFCWPGIEALAQRTRMSERSVKRLITDAEQSAELAVFRGTRNGNRYVVLCGMTETQAAKAVELGAAKSGNRARIAPNELVTGAAPISAKSGNSLVTNEASIGDTVVRKTPTTINQPPITTSRTKELARPNIFGIYERVMGNMVSSHFEAELLNDAVKEYSEEWLEDAFKESVLNGVPKLKYALSILKRWKIEGRKDKMIANPGPAVVRLT